MQIFKEFRDFAMKGDVVDLPIGYGELIMALINFLIVAWALFMVVKAMNRLKRAPVPVTATPKDILLLRDIRDSLRTRS